MFFFWISFCEVFLLVNFEVDGFWPTKFSHAGQTNSLGAPWSCHHRIPRLIGKQEEHDLHDRNCTPESFIKHKRHGGPELPGFIWWIFHLKVLTFHISAWWNGCSSLREDTDQHHLLIHRHHLPQLTLWWKYVKVDGPTPPLNGPTNPPPLLNLGGETTELGGPRWPSGRRWSFERRVVESGGRSSGREGVGEAW